MAINPLQAPINYAGMVPQINIGQQFSELGQVLAERQKRTQAEEIKKTYAIDLQGVINDPSMKKFNDFSLKYPQQREAVKDVASRFTQEQQDSEFNVGRDVAVSLEKFMTRYNKSCQTPKIQTASKKPKRKQIFH